MKEIKVINKSTLLGKEIDVYGSAEEPLFLASDVAEWIGHSNVTEMLRGIDEDEKLTSIILRAGQRRNCNFLTEAGLYEIFMQSTKPIAKQFKKGVKQILKTIRMTGTYSASSGIDDKLKAASWAIDILNMNEVSKLRLVKAVLDPLGLPSPDYVKSKGVMHSASELLKRFGSKVSVLKFNKKMVELGFLREETRQGKEKIHRFKAITAKGLEYGENEVSQHSPNETQPHWYDDKFPELLGIAGFDC